jgi:hypothetical protein
MLFANRFTPDEREAGDAAAELGWRSSVKAPFRSPGATHFA